MREEREPDCSEPGPTISTHTDLKVLEMTLRASGSSAGDLVGPDGHLRDDLKLPKGMNPLHVASLAKDELLLQETLNDARYNGCIDERVCESEIPKGKPVSGRFVLHEGAGGSPLHFALLNGWDEGALLLINALDREDMLENSLNKAGSSLLSMAVGNCDIAVVTRLCEHFNKSPDYEAYLHHTTADGKNLLHHAAQQDGPAVFKYISSQMLQTYEAKRANGEEHAKTPIDAETSRDIDGRTPMDIIRDRVGETHVKHLDASEDARYKKLHQGDWESEWERYYVEHCHGDRISWVPPWKRCCIV